MRNISNLPPFKHNISNYIDRNLKIYYSNIELNHEQQNPPQYFRKIKYTATGKIYTLKKLQQQYKFNEENFVSVSKLKVICFPGILATNKFNQILIKQTTREIFNQNVFGENHYDLNENASNIGLYQPKYQALERYHDLLEYYKDENFIGRESLHVANKILLPLIINNAETRYLLKGFSLGSHELKMAFSHAIKILRQKKLDDKEIITAIDKFIVYNAGASIHWSEQNRLIQLYPKMITLLALEDQGIKHLQATSKLLYNAYHAMSENFNNCIISRNKNDVCNEIIYIPPLAALPITPDDLSHNIKSYATIFQNSRILRKFIRNAISLTQEDLERSWKKIIVKSNAYQMQSTETINYAVTKNKIEKTILYHDKYVLYDDGIVVHYTLPNIDNDFRESIKEIKQLSPYDINHLNEISHVASAALKEWLPINILNGISMMRDKNPYCRRIMVLHGCPTGTSPVLDSEENLIFKRSEQYILQYLLLGLTQLLGCEPMIDNNIQSGAVIANVYPKNSLKKKYNANSPEEFYYHNETAHKNDRPKQFILACNQQDDRLNVITSFILTKDLLQALPEWVLNVIQQQDYTFDGGDVVLQQQAFNAPILKLNHDQEILDFRLNLNPQRMNSHTQEGEIALAYIKTLIKKRILKQYNLHFNPGMVVIADNNASIHMRNCIEPKLLAANNGTVNAKYPLRLLYRVHLQPTQVNHHEGSG